MNSATLQTSARRRVLCIFPQLTDDLSKSAHLLVLRHAVGMNCEPVVLTVGKETDTPGHQDSQWHGIKIRRLVPRSRRWHLLQRFYLWRQVSGKQGLTRMAARVCRPAFLPLTTLMSFPDAHAGAKRELLEQATALHEEEPFDVVLTLYYPLTAHLVGQQVSQRLKIPWIALTKDFYSWPDRLRAGLLRTQINRLKRWYEPTVYRGASALVSISQYMNDYLSTVNKSAPLEVLAHCYDQDAYPSVDEIVPLTFPRPLTLVCVGLTQQQDLPAIRALFDAIAGLQTKGKLSPARLRVRFVGHNGYLVRKTAEELRVTDFVTTTDAVDHATAMRELRQADCLYYMQTPFGTRRRLTEYIGARRAVLAYPSYPGELSEQLLKDSGLGIVANSSLEIADQIVAMLDEFQATQQISRHANEALIYQQSATYRASEFIRLLDRYSVVKQGCEQ